MKYDFKTQCLIKMRSMWRGSSKIVKGNPPLLSPVQKTALELTKKQILLPGNTLRVAPLSQTCYVEGRNIFIKFGYSFLNIKTPTSNFVIELPFPSADSLIQMFNRVTESQRQKMEQKYEISTVKQLENLLKE